MEATTLAPAQVVKFVVGQTYVMRSACDHNAVWNFEVVSRTAKRVGLRRVGGSVEITCGVKVWDGRETCQPQGRFSMSPILRA